MHFFILGITILATILGLIYGFRLFQYYLGLRALKPGLSPYQPSFSIIVPARNEEDKIARCLDSLLMQDYPSTKFDIHVVDDHSSDRTPLIVKEYIQRFPGKVYLHHLSDRPVPCDTVGQRAYKKAAVEWGIQKSRGEIIATIDADCWAQPTWLKTMARHFDRDVGMVCGFVLMHPHLEKNLFHKLQALEFLGLVGAGAGSLGMGEPVVSNAANLAYRRQVFESVGGFRDIDHLPSGDDDLLLQKVHRLTRWKIRFAPEKEAQNFTDPVPTLRAFIQQRNRWASKSTHYRNRWLVFFLACVYFFYLYLFLALPVSLITGMAYPVPLFLLIWKAFFEWLVVSKTCNLTARNDLLKYFPLAELLQIPYILWVGFMGVFGKYSWKGRLSKNYPGWKERPFHKPHSARCVPEEKVQNG